MIAAEIARRSADDIFLSGSLKRLIRFKFFRFDVSASRNRDFGLDFDQRVHHRGNGRGFSVAEVVQMAEMVTGRPVRTQMWPRRRRTDHTMLREAVALAKPNDQLAPMASCLARPPCCGPECSDRSAVGRKVGRP